MKAPAKSREPIKEKSEASPCLYFSCSKTSATSETYEPPYKTIL